MDADPLRLTMAHYFAAGSAAIMQIEADCSHATPQPVCHHFDECDPINPVNVSMEEAYRHVVPLYASIGVDFLPDRLGHGRRRSPAASGSINASQRF